MGVRYRKLYFSSRDHEEVSHQWYVLLWDLRHRYDLTFNVNEGHRTMARQQQLVQQHGLWSQSNPTGAANPSPNAPHIRTGYPNHAIDFDNASGVKVVCRTLGVRLTQPLPSEPWHVDVNRGDLIRYHKRHRVRVWREVAAARAKKAIKIPTRSSNQLVDFLASWEGERLTAYRVPGENFFTIGVGHTGEVNGKKIGHRQVISQDLSRKLLRGDLIKAETAVRKYVPRRWRLRQRRFDTFVSLVFNLGPEILTAAPPLTSLGEILKKPVNKETIEQFARTMQRYNKGGSPPHIMPGLVRRRAAEGILFVTGKYIHN